MNDQRHFSQCLDCANARFVQAAFLTVPGQVSDLIPTDEGYAFLAVLERVPAGPMPEEEEY